MADAGHLPEDPRAAGIYTNGRPNSTIRQVISGAGVNYAQASLAELINGGFIV